MIKNKKGIVYIDMDNVLVNFQSGIDKLSQLELMQYSGQLDNVPGIFSKMIPVEGAISAYNRIASKYDTYILSTAPYHNSSAWGDKLEWVQKYIGEVAYKRLILSHNKNLMIGDYLIDDRLANGAGEFKGELIQFLTDKFKNWDDVCNYLEV